MEEKNNEVNKYIDNISRYLNLKYPNILSDDKISRAKSMFNNSDEDIAINSFRGFIKCLPNAIEKNVIIGDNMASMEIEKNKGISRCL